ncbi:MAG: YcxB family protein [Selenomonas sp.]|uniref:YcxB family protein n=1 Tax=Selenomonas sp. TaxID=2053611 RepID=UPI0025FB74D9|nr:YcxB family protein [Selenomonas sp.]MCR5438312.1 YcxB family protein [Selenomonas sp.]
MSEKEKPQYTAGFVYTDAILRDFEALYLEKKKLSPTARAVLGLLGAAGAAYFGWMLYREGVQFTRIGYLLICSVLLVLAFSSGKKRPDDTIRKYRTAYLNKRASFAFGSDALEMKLEGQKAWARSKYQEVYGLFDTALCFYILVKGRAYYILPKAAVAGDGSGELAGFLQKKCKKHFQHFDLTEKEGESA